MKILDVKSLAIPEVKVIKFARFCDERGYFTEQFRNDDLFNHPELKSLKNVEFMQANQSFSKKGAWRGFHFQWNPFMGKMGRIISGHMLDIVIDIRKDSPTFGKALAYDMKADNDRDYDEWIWVPPGFAHGIFFKEESIMEYFCTGTYNKDCEAGLSPLTEDIDWSLCDSKTLSDLEDLRKDGIITEKDKAGLSIKEWDDDERSENFIYDELIKKGIC